MGKKHSKQFNQTNQDKNQVRFIIRMRTIVESTDEVRMNYVKSYNENTPNILEAQIFKTFEDASHYLNSGAGFQIVDHFETKDGIYVMPPTHFRNGVRKEFLVDNKAKVEITILRINVSPDEKILRENQIAIATFVVTSKFISDIDVKEVVDLIDYEMLEREEHHHNCSKCKKNGHCLIQLLKDIVDDEDSEDVKEPKKMSAFE